ncbi:HK97 gp10 family phage protein [Bacillus sp. z60-18]|uniref:HK97 gp10 family phage protein n=1 Tax=unclassified Bacillus (in: firmicutes) TaxID=185979 RepID=UPI00390C4AAD
MASNDIAREIAQALKEFTGDVERGLEKEKERVAKEGAAKLKRTSPKDTGKYAKGWREKKNGSARVVYNATKPQLTHLLEKGHAKRGGGRVAGKEHIRPVEQEMIEEFEAATERIIRG